MPILDLQVPAGVDDGRSNVAGTGWFDNAANIAIVGHWAAIGDNLNAFFLFTGVAGLAGTIVTVANLSFFTWTPGQLGNPLTRVFLEKSAAPVAPANAGDHAGRVRTIAGTNYDPVGLLNDTWYNNVIDVQPQLQEIITAGLNPTSILVLWDDRGSPGGVDNYFLPSAWERGGAGAFALKMHIEANLPTSGGSNKASRLIGAGII